ncbi:MAG TPA: M48 family metalloprotease [Vicinamibacteria bacterium]
MIRSRGRSPLAAWLASLLGFLLALPSCATNPATGRKQLTLVSEAQEIQMGQQADQEAAAAIGIYDERGLGAYVQQVGSTLAAQSERPSLEWTFRVANDAAVNAFALPGGHIYVTRGILTHMSSEAELASVLGHEIGHVTARHTVSQMTKAQLANVGLALGMILRPQLMNFGNLAELGLNLLFLKYSRNDENQADELGLRYISRTHYDPAPMLTLFDTLDRISSAEGEGRVPSWLATHPSPGNRSQHISQLIQQLPPGQKGQTLRREEFLRKIDGMVFGEDPREGFFRENVFYHPELRFRVAFPRGWKTSNLKQAVGATSPNQDAVVVVTLANRPSPEQAAREFFSQQGVQQGPAWRGDINGLPAVANQFAAVTDQGELRGIAAFLSHNGKVFQILGYTPASRYAVYDREISASVNSFARETDRRVLSVQPKHLEIVPVTREMTLQEFNQRHPSTVPLSTVAIINEVDQNGRLAAGTLAKRVVGGEVP